MSQSFSTHYAPTIGELNRAFGEEIDALGGSVTGCYDDGERLFMRAVLPLADDVAPGDTINAGIAVRTSGPVVFVHPYTMRQVCTNGAISAQATQSVRIERVAHNGIVVPTYDSAATLARFADAIQSCASPDAFLQATDDMRSAMHTPVNLGIQFLEAMNQVSPAVGRSLMNHVFDELQREEEHTLFAYMNAITATARDTADPEMRWYLEELGAAVIARVRSPREALVTSLAG